MQKHIVEHFRTRDPILHDAFLRTTSLHNNFLLKKSDDYFVSLCREIIGQQLNDKVANTIFARFKKLFPKGKISAESLLKLTDQAIRDIGPSWSKVRFLKDLADKITSKTLDLIDLDQLDNENVVKELMKVKGIGPWTAEMFLMFALAREDVFSHGDYGLRRAIKLIYPFKREPTKNQIERLSQKWIPYRTYACIILWESLET